MIGIVCAMKEEADVVIEQFKLEKREDSFFSIYGNDQMVLIISKIGKVQSAIATTYLLNHFDVRLIINIGVAGTLKGTIPIGTVALVETVLQHDGLVPNAICPDYFVAPLTCKKVEGFFDIPRVTLLTGDEFVHTLERINILRLKGDIVDMEGYSVAMVAQTFHIPCVLIKGISDGASERGFEVFLQNFDRVMHTTVSLLESFLQEI